MPNAPSPKVVVITGASSGNGRAAAILFARKGWRVGLIARNPDTLDAVRGEVVTEGGTASVAIADVADSAALGRAADHVEAELGPIDVWVNNAGTGIFGRFLDVPEDEFQRLTDVNYMGVVNGTRIALRRMAARRQGTIVQVLSAIGLRGVPLQSAYSGAKWGLRGFTEAVRSELIADDIPVRVSMVFPPSVNTPFFEHAVSYMPRAVRPPPPMYQPEVIADAIHLAATTGRREVRVSSTTWGFALGNAIAPRVMDVFAGKFGTLAQQSHKPVVSDPNLMRPGNTAAVRGRFGAESRGFSVQMAATKNRGAVALGLGLVLLAALAGRRRT